MLEWSPSNDLGGYINLHDLIRICKISAEVSGPTKRQACLEDDQVGNSGFLVVRSSGSLLQYTVRKGSDEAVPHDCHILLIHIWAKASEENCVYEHAHSI